MKNEHVGTSLDVGCEGKARNGLITMRVKAKEGLLFLNERDLSQKRAMG